MPAPDSAESDSTASGAAGFGAADIDPAGTHSAGSDIDPAFAPNQRRLALAQLLSGVGIASGVAVGALLVEDLTSSTRWAGLAQTMTVLGAGVLALPMARLAHHRGRRVALSWGFALGTVGALLIILGGQTRQTLVLFAGLALFGSATAAGLQSRYAATDLAPPHLRARSMSIVVWATTVGSVAGPNLSGPGASVGERLGLHPLVGPYAFSVVAFATAALVVWTLRSPQRALHQTGRPRAGLAECWAAVMASGRATVGLVAVVTGQMMMVLVMVMTPLHMDHEGMSLELIGIVISVHILGMYAFSPVVGWAVDRWGHLIVIVAGGVLFGLSFVIGILDASQTSSLGRLLQALGLLGIAWSCTLIAGSSLLSQSVPAHLRVPTQGLTDTAMNLGAALVAASAGSVLAWGGFVAINTLAATVLLLLALVFVQRQRGEVVSTG